jgi:hypothetical protein
MSATAQNIYQRINAVRKAIGYVQKDKSVSAGSAGSYRAVTHDAVTGMVRAALIENGVIIVPSVTSAVFHPKEPEAKQRLYEATYQIDFVNMDSPEERISIAVNAHALDNGDKAPGKALSYATKYGILKLFNIETGEDEESRYQQEEFDTVGHVDFILASANDKELKDRYSAAYTIARDAKDKDAMKALIAAKDARKTQLQRQAEGQA